MLALQKNYFFSLFSPLDFLFEISVISILEPFLRGGGGNSLKQTYIEGVHVKRTGTNKGGKGVKNWKFRANILFE